MTNNPPTYYSGNFKGLGALWQEPGTNIKYIFYYTIGDSKVASNIDVQISL